MEENKKIFITHYFKAVPPKSGMTPVTFLTATADSRRNGIYYLGYKGRRELSWDELKFEIENGGLIELSVPEPANPDKQLWMDKDKGIYLADKDRPHNDNTRKLINKPETEPEAIYRRFFDSVVKAHPVSKVIETPEYAVP